MSYMRFWSFVAGFGAALNMMDAIMTCIEIERGMAIEGNPLMAFAYQLSVPLFFLTKLFAVGLFGWLALNAENRIARAGIALGVTAYIGIAGYHMLGFLS